MATKDALLEQVDKALQARYETETRRNFSSDAKPAKEDETLKELYLPDDERGRMPLTKDRYLVKENPRLVQWEREVRKFLRNLSPAHGHRISAAMIYEWATGVNIAELMKSGGSANRDLRHINTILRFYFDKPYMTYIAGRKVPRAYRVKPGTYITRRRPLTLTLWAEYTEGVLYP